MRYGPWGIVWFIVGCLVLLWLLRQLGILA